MKKQSMFCIILLVILSPRQAFALPGVYKAGAATITMATGMCRTRTISLDGTGFGTSPLVSGGFLIQNTNETAVNIADCECYDGTLTPANWDPGISPVFDPTGYPGVCVIQKGR